MNITYKHNSVILFIYSMLILKLISIDSYNIVYAFIIVLIP